MLGDSVIQNIGHRQRGSSTLRAIGAQPSILHASNAETRPNFLDDVLGLSRETIEALPVALYTTDAEGRITFYNEAAAALWGCRPKLGDSEFCGSWKLYRPDGTPLPHDECPMATALKEKRPIRGVEAIAERPDGTRISFIPHPTPLFDATGTLTGAVNMLVDVSERRRAEAALHESEARFAGQRKALELALNGEPLAISLGVLVRTAIDQLGEGVRAAFYLANSAHTELHHVVGMSAAYAEAVDGFEIGPASLSCGLATHTGQPILTPDVAKEPRWKPLLWLAEKFDFRGCWSFPIRTEAGRFVGTLAIYWRRPREATPRELELAAVLTATAAIIIARHTDAEQRDQAQAALRKSEERLRELLGALPAAIFVTDAGGHITYYNQAAVELWGRRPELGKDRWFDLARPYCADGKPARLADCPTELALRRGKSVRGLEAILERADGTRIPVLPYPTPLRDATGAIVGVVNMTVDISERQKAERILAERNAQLALAGRAALVGSYVYDVNKGTMQISEGYATIHGLPDGTTERTISEWRSRVHPEDLARTEGLRELAFAEGRKEDNAEYRIFLSTGELRWIERRGVISHGEDGRPKRVVGVDIDVTERKRAEQHRQALNAELDHRVKNVLATVSAIIAQTQEASNSRAEFVSGLNSRINSLSRAHELLSQNNWRGVSLAELIRRELEPYTIGNTEAKGPSVTLMAEATQAVATVLHELTTNAAKYGALSNRSGRVSVRWWWLQNGSHDRLIIEWQETGGPPVLTPSRSGYGTTIIRELIPFEFGGAVELSFATGGTRCRLEIPAEWAGRGRERSEEG